MEVQRKLVHVRPTAGSATPGGRQHVVDVCVEVEFARGDVRERWTTGWSYQNVELTGDDLLENQLAFLVSSIGQDLELEMIMAGYSGVEGAIGLAPTEWVVDSAVSVRRGAHGA